jgi:hypothetical protein
MKLPFKSQVARGTLRMLYGPFERAQFYTSGLDGRPRAHYASVSDYQRVMLFAHIARNHYGALALLRLTLAAGMQKPPEPLLRAWKAWGHETPKEWQ